jgi:hypothetical protein
MANIKNLNPENKVALDNFLSKMNEFNPEVKWEFYPMTTQAEDLNISDVVDVESKILMIEDKIDNILYKYKEKSNTGYRVDLLRYYRIEEDIEKLLKEELKECYRDVKELSGEFSEKEFEAWFNYKYKKEKNELFN